jgi:hypothetical protein
MPECIRVYDHSGDPRVLLHNLADSLLELRAEQWLPVLHVRRQWLHGSHLVITVRALEESRARLEEAAAYAGSRAGELTAAVPADEEYLRRAEQLARWERIAPPYLPVHPQGFVQIGQDALLERWPTELMLARDQILSRMLEPVLASCRLRPADPARHVARLMATLATAHPYGLGLGTLSFRSHAEAFCAAVGSTVDLKATFTERLPADAAFFRAVLAGEGLAGGGDEMPAAEAHAVDLWSRAFQYAWGVAEALTAGGHLDEHVLNRVGMVANPLGPNAPSAFHTELDAVGMVVEPPYWHVAHRLVINCLYTSLTCLGITPVQRYYLCFGLSEATDGLLAEGWSERIHRLGEDRALAQSTAAN